MRMIVAAKTRMNSTCQQPPSARLHTWGGHRDSSRLLGKSCRPKKWGATRAKNLSKKEGKSRISHRVSGGGTGSTRTVDAEHKCAPSWNQIPTLKDCLCCHICYVHRCTHLYRTVRASRAVSNRESRYPPRGRDSNVKLLTLIFTIILHITSKSLSYKLVCMFIKRI